MLRQCNLDSAYDNTKEFVLKSEVNYLVSEESWRSRRAEFRIPGLKCVTVSADAWKKK